MSNHNNLGYNACNKWSMENPDILNKIKESNKKMCDQNFYAPFNFPTTYPYKQEVR